MVRSSGEHGVDELDRRRVIYFSALLSSLCLQRAFYVQFLPASNILRDLKFGQRFAFLVLATGWGGGWKGRGGRSRMALESWARDWHNFSPLSFNFSRQS